MSNTLTICDVISPNQGARREAARPDLLVIHYTAMQSAEAAIARLCAPEAEVSAHYVISERGQITRLVPEEMRAWHAGAGRWGDVTDVNSHSIGIELANRGNHPFPEPQMARLELLISEIMARWAIPPERVIGHSDMAPGRKGDPGARFDWARLARGKTPEGEEPPWSALNFFPYWSQVVSTAAQKAAAAEILSRGREEVATRNAASMRGA